MSTVHEPFEQELVSLSAVEAVRVQKEMAARRRQRDNKEGYLFIAPWLIGFLIFTFLPLLGSIYLAFTDYNLTSAPKWVGLQNFETMFFNDVRYWKSVKATFFYVLTAIPLRLAFALGVAVLLNNGRRLISTYRAAFYAPSIVGGSVAVALMWRRLFSSDGLLNAFLGSMGIPADSAWIGRPETAIWTLILLAVWQFGSPMLIFLAGLRQVPESSYEAAAIDGASVARASSSTSPFRCSRPSSFLT